MQFINMNNSWFRTHLLIFISVLCLLNITCTQKSPMEPNKGITDDIPRFTNFQASPSQISIGGVQSSVQLQLVNQNGNPIAGETVQFSTSLGTITQNAATDDNGWARVVLTSGSESGIAEIKATYQNVNSTVRVIFSSSTRGNLKIQSDKNELYANGSDYTNIIVSLIGDSAEALPGEQIYIRSSVGQIQDVVTTLEDGTGELQLVSVARTLDTTATVVATWEGSDDTLEVTLPIYMKGVTFEMSAKPLVILADGVSTSTVTASIKETNTRIPITEQSVHFGTDLGLITSEAYTNAEGIAEVILTSSDSTGVAHVIGYYGNKITATVDVTLIERTQSPHQVSEVEVSQNYLLANGVDVVEVSVLVKDESQTPVQGDTIFFQSNTGVVKKAYAITDLEGVAKTSVMTRASHADSTCQIDIHHSGHLVASPKVEFLGVELGLTAYPKTVLADGKSSAKIQAHLKESTSKIPVSNANIRFGSSLGTITGLTQTNEQGVATVYLTSTQQQGTAYITCIYGNRIDSTVTVQFQPSIPDSIYISANPRFLPADLKSQAVITATVKDAYQNPVPDGTIVQFVVNGTGSLEYPQVETEGGIATNILTSGDSPDTVQVVASIQVDETTTISNQIEIRYHVGDAYYIELNADPEVLPANGVDKARITARVLDANDNIIDKATVNFQASFGDIISSVKTDDNGIATAYYSSHEVGLATITASVDIGNGTVIGSTTIEVVPGEPYSITVSYNPHFMYVRDCGKNQTVTIFADIVDEKNNPVADSTDVRFRIYASPGNGDALSSINPDDPDDYTYTIPTVNGRSQVAYTSGTRSGTARIQADVFDDEGNIIVTGISTEIVIYGGPSYMEDISDPNSTHLTVTSRRLNIWYGIDTTTITILVGDKYNNPVQDGTAVYLTSSGGVVTTKAYTNENGLANVLLQAGNPLPTIDRYYNYTGLQDPNTGAVIGNPATDKRIPDMEDGIVLNSYGDRIENDGFARIMARSEGVDEDNNSVQVWDLHHVIFSEEIPGGDFRGNPPLYEAPRFWSYVDKDTIDPGEFTTIEIELWDRNGNPIVGGSEVRATAVPSGVKAELSWTSRTTSDPGVTRYNLRLYNTIDPTKEEDIPGWANVVIDVFSMNGDAQLTTDGVYLNKPVVVSP